MAKKSAAIPILVLTVFLRGFLSIGSGQSSPLNLYLLPQFINIKGDKTPLSEVLRQLSHAVYDDYVLFGVESRLTNGGDPPIRLQVEQGDTVGDALNEILRQIPGYRFEVVSKHLIHIFPKDALEDPNDLLNLHISQFDMAGARTGVILTWPQQFIPEIEERLNPKGPGHKDIHLFMGPVGIGPDITLHLQNVTVRQILNSVSMETEKTAATQGGVGWYYSYQPDPDSRIGWERRWTFIMSSPPKWYERLFKLHLGQPQREPGH